MSVADGRELNAPVASARAVLAVFAGTLFLSAFLLFSVQPFFAKLVLPRLGGTPAVWSVAMVFFQTVLLAGYLYAHFLTRHLTTKAGAVVHLGVLLLTFLALPIAIPAGWEQPWERGQAVWLLGLFTVSVGLPFFAVSASAPLIQVWFSRTSHPHARDPYFLYGASNIGSFASLLAFIVLIEPLSTLGQQATLWTAGFAVLSALVGTCAVLTLHLASGAAGRTVPQSSALSAAVRIDGSLRARWLVLAFVPSGLLVAATAHISVDIAAAPFLWVTPLALFLLTFVIAFRHKPLPLDPLARSLPWFAALPILSIAIPGLLPLWAKLGAHLLFFFLAALTCHAMLYARRPQASDLTSFYLWMSFGGVLGGAFASLVSPFLFDWIAEYLILIVAALAVARFHSGRHEHERQDRRRRDGVEGQQGGCQASGAADFGVFLAALAMLIAGLWVFARCRARPVFLPIVLLLIPTGLFGAEVKELFRDRSFFGVVTVTELDGYNVMTHGTTVHGVMRLDGTDGESSSVRPEPLSYYHRSGGIARALFAAQERAGGAIGRGGVVGLGTGSVLCHSRPGEAWVGFEIDPAIVEIARDPALFRFLSDCQPDLPVVLGDARLTLAGEPDGGFDYLLIDAFSSDAIPAHLMTTEAVRLYMDKLAPDGILTMHISNRYLELGSVVAAIAEAEGLTVRLLKAAPPVDVDRAYPSIVAVLARSEDALGPIASDPEWETIEAGGTTAWTDDYSNIVSALARRF